jgi:hypothetical protein
MLGVAAVAMTLAACGSSSSGVSPATYVRSICQAVGPFEKDVQARSNSLNLSSISSATQGKQALQSFLNSAAADTDTAVNKLKTAGTPNVKNGKQIGNAIVDAFTKLKAALSVAATQAGSLPTSSPTAFKTAAQSLGATVQTSMSSIGSSLSNLKSADLEAAAKKEPACQSVGA